MKVKTINYIQNKGVGTIIITQRGKYINHVLRQVQNLKDRLKDNIGKI